MSNISSNKCLIAYYSRKGSNYMNGSIVNLTVGNTAVIANKIKEIINGNLFEIDTVKAYPEDYDEATVVAKDELRKNARPELNDTVRNMADYDIIYLGYPNWWGTFPMAVFTFLESYDFSGKIIIPFCTHEGSGLGRSESDIRKLCPKATVLAGIAIRGSAVSNSDRSLQSWLKNAEALFETRA